jgi:hypothetical protein
MKPWQFSRLDAAIFSRSLSLTSDYWINFVLYLVALDQNVPSFRSPHADRPSSVSHYSSNIAFWLREIHVHGL